MTAEEVQRLELKDLDSVLVRAKAEQWSELALLPTSTADPRYVEGLVRQGWSADRVIFLTEPLTEIPLLLNRPGFAGGSNS
jgi:hypothetical protein